MARQACTLQTSTREARLAGPTAAFYVSLVVSATW